jgi:hypothetical protein
MHYLYKGVCINPSVIRLLDLITSPGLLCLVQRFNRQWQGADRSVESQYEIQQILSMH